MFFKRSGGAGGRLQGHKVSDVELKVIKADGSTVTASDKQKALLDAAQKLIQADAHFQQLNAPTVSRAEVNEGVEETAQGYLYLRYDVQGAIPQEFWAHWGHADKVAWKSGNISVKEAPAAAQETAAAEPKAAKS